ncbi:MAG TPA: hypothetical protein DEF45_20795 [Rhodopirellula sp.]|nr:MAG: hypothetical protein CBD74_07025 [Saprospirales bacterium TMED214]HBV65450.1 hypothetical protein [Rhodopirellula sp.]
MNQAIADPEQLRQFAAHLNRFTEEIKNLSNNLSGHMNQLEQTWRDEQQRKFADDFNSQMQQMGRLIKASEQHVPYLLRKAEQIDAYLGR